MKTRKYVCWLLALLYCLPAFSQTPIAVQRPDAGSKICLHEGWYARNVREIGEDGNRLTAKPFESTGWMKAKVPGTVLTTLLENKIYPAPEFGLNNQLIPDIYQVGRDFYTYWFVCPFTMDTLQLGQHAWLNFRGINYKAEIYLNGKRVNASTHEGMFLRQSYDITPYLKGTESNVLAVLVFPPDHVGNPNGGQGGDGQIARNCTMQYTPGWDWIQPVRDRNTGIWDEVSIAVTKDVRVQHPYVVTKVPGVRVPSASKQEPAYLETSVELENVSDQIQKERLLLLIMERSFGFRSLWNRAKRSLFLSPKKRSVILSCGGRMVSDSSLWKRFISPLLNRLRNKSATSSRFVSVSGKSRPERTNRMADVNFTSTDNGFISRAEIILIPTGCSGFLPSDMTMKSASMLK